MNGSLFVITAAGGNATAIEVLEKGLSRGEPADQTGGYAARGKQLGDSMAGAGAEQAGFLIPAENHFEMGGGEFCGNAARSAAILLSEIKKMSAVSFTMSGYAGTVSATVQKTGGQTYQVQCRFPKLPVDRREVTLQTGQRATIVDLGGIVQIVIEEEFPTEPAAHQTMHRSIMNELGLGERSAVGVVWLTRSDAIIKMHPVVWVKDVNTFFYEQSSGSGAIAAAQVSGANLITQPTGGIIEVDIKPDAVSLSSEMKIIRGEI